MDKNVISEVMRAMGRKGGKKGGKSRMDALSPVDKRQHWPRKPLRRVRRCVRRKRPPKRKQKGPTSKKKGLGSRFQASVWFALGPWFFLDVQQVG